MSEQRSEVLAPVRALLPGDSAKEERSSNAETAHIEPSGSLVPQNDRASDTVATSAQSKMRSTSFRAGQNRVLEMIATGAPLADVLTSLVLLIEAQAEEMLGSILLLDEDGIHLRHGAAPNLPDAYTKSIDGLSIGPQVGSCGTAMYRREQVIVTDTLKDPLWSAFRDLATAFGLRACWSTPIFGPQGKVLGSFAMYYSEPRSPSPAEARLTTIAVHVAGIAIEHQRTEAALRASEEAWRQAEQKYHNIFENTHEGIFQTTEDGRFLVANPAMARMLGFDSAADLIDARIDIARQHYVAPGGRDELKRLLDKYGAVTDLEHQAFRKDGSTIWISENVRAVRGQNGVVLYYEGTAQDITERKRAENKSASFATLARKLSGAVTALSAAQIIADTAHDLFGWDSLTLDLYDADQDLVHPMLNVDTIGERLVDVTPPDDNYPPSGRRRRVIQRGAELIIREEPYEFDNDSVPFGDKSRPSAALMNVPIRHAFSVVGILSIQSYTPRVYDDAALGDLQALADHCGEALNRIRTEQSLYESEERYRDLVENSREFICTHDLDGLILSANRAAAEVLGYKRNDYVGKKNLREILAPEIRHGFDDYLIKIRREGFACGQMLVQTCRGERRIWEYYNTVRTEGVTTPIVRGMAHDITERKRAEEALRESEERYRELFENAKDAMYVHDLRGRCTSINCAAEELTGYSRKEILGKDFAELVVPEHMKGVRDRLCKKLADGTETVYEVEVLTRDGRRVPVEVNSRLIYENGIPVGVQGTVRDITERKNSQAALQNFSRRLMEAQEAERERLSRELHDEIGQVLTAVRINMDAVQREGNTPAVASHIEDSLSVIDEALRQVRDMSLDLRPPHLDDFGLTSALRWYIDRYSKRAGNSARFIDEQPADPPRLRRDLETACFRIVQEALTNVARHANAKSVSVKLARSNGYLLLTIEDDGAGFEVGALRKYASANATLGVRGMEERAEAVGGRIEIESAKGKGTKIRARFPIARPKV